MCAFDGGDCCKETCDLDSHYGCSAQTSEFGPFGFYCVNPSLTEEHIDSTACTVSDRTRIGDGRCDAGVEMYNSEACNWDGGDCCAETCNQLYAHYNCGDSAFPYDCKNPEIVPDTFPPSSPPSSPPPASPPVQSPRNHRRRQRRQQRRNNNSMPPSPPSNRRPSYDIEGVGRNRHDSLLALELPHHATEREIRTQFRKMSLKYHPDRYSPDIGMTLEEATSHFQLINNAHEFLNHR